MPRCLAQNLEGSAAVIARADDDDFLRPHQDFAAFSLKWSFSAIIVSLSGTRGKAVIRHTK